MSREVARLNQLELDNGVSDAASWHQDYRDTAWIFAGNLSPELCEGDVLCVFSQFGEIDDLVFPRDDTTGRPKGFCFIKFEDARSAVLSVDNLNDSELLGRSLRVDHHRPSEKKGGKLRDATIEERLEAIQPGAQFKQVQGPYSLEHGLNVFAKQEQEEDRAGGDWRARAAVEAGSEEDPVDASRKKHHKKEKKKRKKAKREEEREEKARDLQD